GEDNIAGEERSAGKKNGNQEASCAEGRDENRRFIQKAGSEGQNADQDGLSGQESWSQGVCGKNSLGQETRNREKNPRQESSRETHEYIRPGRSCFQLAVSTFGIALLNLTIAAADSPIILFRQ
ncbi:MAG: hypothetical protein L0H15_02475, partial [Nitrosospira sp.]|nr:hypothetical protein [Nitrosospira sp.]